MPQPVDMTPFYDAKSNSCMNPNAEVGHETCDPEEECNECDGLSGSCEDVAKMFSLSVECFKKLNPDLDCEIGVKGGDTFCQGSGNPEHDDDDDEA